MSAIGIVSVDVAQVGRLEVVMQSLPAVVLLCGRSRELVETREWVLEQAGYRVAVARDAAGVTEAIQSSSPRVLLLCHSLTQTDVEEAVTAAVSRLPGIPVVLLTGLTGEGRWVNCDVWQEAVSVRPEMMLAGVRRAVEAVEARV